MDFPKWWEQTEEELMVETLGQLDKKWDKREGSFLYDAVKGSVIQHDMGRTELKNVFYMMFVKDATGELLDMLIESRTPLKRFKATFTTGQVLVTGNPDTPISADTRYMSIIYNAEDELVEFKQEEKTIIDQDGTVLVNVKCLKPGRVGNIPENSIEIASPLIGVAKVTNIVAFDNGLDKEDDDTFRNRYYKWMKENGTSGNIANYIRWALEVEGVGGVQVLSLWDGKGTVKLLLVDQNYYPASAQIINRALEYIDPIHGMGEGKAPIGATVTIAAGEQLLLNISADIQLKQGYSIEGCKSEFISSMNKFLLSLNEQYWQNTRTPIVQIINFLKLGSYVVDTNGVASATNLLINNATENITVTPGKVVTLGMVTFNVIP